MVALGRADRHLSPRSQAAGHPCHGWRKRAAPEGAARWLEKPWRFSLHYVKGIAGPPVFLRRRKMASKPRPATAVPKIARLAGSGTTFSQFDPDD
jgi:hypothetical protein